MRPSTPAVWATLLALAAASPLPTSESTPLQRRYDNYFDCRSEAHPNPVILIHALFVNENFDVNFLGYQLRSEGYCTFIQSYGRSLLPGVAGVQSIETSSQEVADFILEVKQKTGAAKVDLVGHSEGGFQALYVPKFYPGIAPIVDKIVTIASPTHGTTYNGVTNWIKDFRGTADWALTLLGCPACHEVLVDSKPVKKLTKGTGVNGSDKIGQPGNTILALASDFDGVVTPTENAFIYNETSVTNKKVQARCPRNRANHLSIVTDRNVWDEVRHFLDPTYALPTSCV